MQVLKPHQARVMTEKAELDTKKSALYDFVKNGQPAGVDVDEYARLLAQYRIMQVYSQILGERIAHFQP